MAPYRERRFYQQTERLSEIRQRLPFFLIGFPQNAFFHNVVGIGIGQHIHLVGDDKNRFPTVCRPAEELCDDIRILFIKVRSRLGGKKDPGVPAERPGNGYTAQFAAGKFGGIRVFQQLDPQFSHERQDVFLFFLSIDIPGQTDIFFRRQAVNRSAALGNDGDIFISEF